MKKLLILILIALLLALSIFIVMNNVEIGKLEILGITGIQQRNSELDSKIQQAAKLAEKDYKQAVSDVETSAKKLKEEKQNYEDLTSISSEGDVQTANQIEKYEIETLWVRLGNHATSQGVVMQMDVMTGSSNMSEYYDLKFTAIGSYISITDFISAIENDSTLGFKIEEFKMAPNGETGELQATFVCKDIAIKDVSATTNTATQNDNTQTDQSTTNTNNATNTTNTANNTNTTNATNNTNNTNNTNVSTNTNTNQ